MARLHDLSNELLFQIISHLPTKRKELYNLCLTSRVFHAVAISLYVRTYCYHHEFSRRSPATFLTGVLRHQISSCIRRVYLENWQVERFPLGGWTHLTDKETQQRLCDAAEKFKFPAEIAIPWKAALSDALDDAIFALMLLLADGLQELYLVLPFSSKGKSPWLFRLLRAAHAIPSSVQYQGLQDLRSVCLESSRGSMFFQLDFLAPLFALPALRKFQASQCIGSRGGCSSDWPQDTSPVESIRFEESRLDAGSIYLLLGACKGLKHFHLGWSQVWGDRDTDWIQGQIDHVVLEAALRSQTNSLESFEFIDNRYDDNPRHYDKDCLPLLSDTSPISFLGEFPALKSLKIPQAWL